MITTEEPSRARMGNLRWTLGSLGDAETPSLGETVSFPLWGRDHILPPTLYKIPLANGVSRTLWDKNAVWSRDLGNTKAGDLITPTN